MELRQYLDEMAPDGIIAYANRCGISPNYLKIHVKYASKDPSVSLIRALAQQSEGAVTVEAVLRHFKILDPVQPTERKKATQRSPRFPR